MCCNLPKAAYNRVGRRREDAAERGGQMGREGSGMYNACARNVSKNPQMHCDDCKGAEADEKLKMKRDVAGTRGKEREHAGCQRNFDAKTM